MKVWPFGAALRGRDKNRAASFHGATDGRSQDLVGGDAIGRVSAVAVGRLDDDRAGARWCLSCQEHRVACSPKVTGKQDGVGTDRDQVAGRTQDVTRSDEGQMCARLKGTALVVAHCLDELVVSSASAALYSGRGGSCLEKPQRRAFSAS